MDVRMAIDQRKARNCKLLHLTTDKKRPDRQSFYERLGFVASHVGYKMVL